MEDQKLSAKIVDITDDGNCIAKADSLVYFLAKGVVGDQVLIQPTVKKKNYCLAELVEVIEPSVNRIKSDCPYSERCGGCSLREYTYDAQIRLKARKVCEKIKRSLRIQSFKLDKIIPATKINYYRNNVQLKSSFNTEKLKIGFFEKASHKIVEIEHCLLLPRIMNQALINIKSFLESLYWNKSSGKDFDLDNLKEIVLRTNERESELMLVLIKKSFSKNIQKYKAAIENFAESSKIISIYEKNSDGQLNLLYGKAHLKIKILDKSFQLSPNSFFQVNTKQSEKLFLEVLSQLKAEKIDIVFDLFCGVGSISLIIAEYVKKLYGIELEANAVKDAEENARLNKIHNAEFIFGSVEKIFNENFHSSDGLKLKNVHKLLLDPPRAGLKKSTIETIAKTDVRKLVYVSCNPASLARDLKIFSDNGFVISYSAIVDMFPFTQHIESIVQLIRK